ncbi:MAG: SOS response-associated peptidase [Phycisphaerae bacterium]
MCGRYTLTVPIEQVEKLFDVDQATEQDIPPRYNIAPTQNVPAVIENTDRKRQLRLFHWGLIPFWADDPAIGNRLINARIEGAAQKNAFKAAMKYRRCLIAADGFFEWKKSADGKQPLLFRRKDRRPFALAGLWETWKKADQTVRSCTILTQEPNELVKPVHNRMPVVLPKDKWEKWLDVSLQDAAAAADLVEQWEADEFEAYPVTKQMNSPQFEDPKAVEPVDE